MSDFFNEIIPFLQTESGVVYFSFFMLQNTKLLYRFYIEPNLQLRFDDFFED